MTQNLPKWDNSEKAAARPTWQPQSHAVVFDNPWIRVEAHDVLAPTGHKAHYGLVKFANRAVGVLPLFDDGTVAMVGQARFPLGNYSWEMPEGGVPFGEDLVHGAMRELREETGLAAESLRLILEMELSNSVSDEVATCYLATGLSRGDQAPDETEVFEYARVPFKDVLEAVIKGQVRDSLTVATVLRTYHMAVTGDLAPHLCEAILR